MPQKGIIFDIQRASLHDGPGIRTTVFLKGCPLRCIWCHNPESWILQPQLLYKEYKCAGCLSCVSACSSGAHNVSREGTHLLNREQCQNCFQCVEECVYGALKASGWETDIIAVMKEVEKDCQYYMNSGGGITLSGGEPMLQFEFTLNLLKAASARNIHTCLETCGFGKREQYQAVMRYTDLFLFDMKSVDSQKHYELTGVHNEIILENLDFLYAGEAAIVLRCPLVPGVNDSDDQLEGIAALSRKYPGLKGIELLPYHNMGRKKWAEAGYAYPLDDIGNTEESVKRTWISKLRKMGCDKAVLA